MSMYMGVCLSSYYGCVPYESVSDIVCQICVYNFCMCLFICMYIFYMCLSNVYKCVRMRDSVCVCVCLVFMSVCVCFVSV